MRDQKRQQKTSFFELFIELEKLEGIFGTYERFFLGLFIFHHLIRFSSFSPYYRLAKITLKTDMRSSKKVLFSPYYRGMTFENHMLCAKHQKRDNNMVCWNCSYHRNGVKQSSLSRSRANRISQIRFRSENICNQN